MLQRTKIGIIGCGTISSIYMQAGNTFEILEIVACADIDITRAQAQAERFHIPKACSVAELLADPSIEIVINLTIPKAHAEVALASIAAGKSVYNEKPLAISREDGKAILEAARARGVRVGCAPDTFLGGGIQTCRQLIDEGSIGEPIGAAAFMMTHGPESWHPDPDFYYQPGGGPLFDMGPYYFTTLITLMGPVRRVSGSARISSPERIITSQPRYGRKIEVTTPTHLNGICDFASGAIATITTSFDVWGTRHPHMEIYGTEGTLLVPDPNTFGGPVFIHKARENEWQDIPLSHGYTQNSRGIGVADMAYALRSGRQHRANGEMAYHVLDIMHAISDSSNEGRHIMLNSTCIPPTALPTGLVTGQLDT
jgi:predicted dehydrogenase